MAQPNQTFARSRPAASVAEHDGRVLGRREVSVGAAGGGVIGRVPRRGGGRGGVGGGVHGLLGLVEVGLESHAEGEVAEGHGAKHHHPRAHRVLPRPATPRAHRRHGRAAHLAEAVDAWMGSRLFAMPVPGGRWAAKG